MPKIRLNKEDSEVMMEFIDKRINGRIWEELSASQVAQEKIVSREFIAWVGDGKARSVADLAHLSDHYHSLPSKNDTLEGLSASLLPGDVLIYMDLKSGYDHFRLHKDMRKYFIVSVLLANGVVRYFRYVVLPFGWSKSNHWFCRLVNRAWTMVKRRFGYRVCSYVDDFAAVSSMGRPATSRDFLKASKVLNRLLKRYGITRHPIKGVWDSGSQVITHLGFMIDTVRGTFGVSATKLDKIEVILKRLHRMARSNARRVPVRELASFIGRAQSLRLAVPDTAFRLRELYADLHGKEDIRSALENWPRFVQRATVPDGHGPV